MENLSRVFVELDQIPFTNIAMVLAGAWLTILILQKVVPRFAERLPPRFRNYALPLVPILRLLIILGAGLEVLPRVIDPNTENVLAIIGALSVALGFAFKDYVSGLVAGVVATYEQPYRPGDWVRVGNAYGEVRSTGMRSFKLVTPDDDVVTIPHTKIWTDTIFNANDGAPDHMCVAEFYLDPEHDAAAVRDKLLDVARTSAYLQLNRPVTVVVQEKPWGTQYRLKAYPRDNRHEFPFVTDLTVRGKSALAAMGARPVRAAVAAN